MKTAKHLNSASQDSRSAILAAATRLFAQKGLSGVSVKEISQAAGTNTALLFYYFQNKPQLYATLIKEAGNKVPQGFAKLLNTKKAPLSKLTQALNFFLDTLQNNRDLVRLAVREIYGFGEFMQEELLELRNSALSPFKAIIAQGIKERVFREVDPEITAIALLNQAHFFAGYNLLVEPISREKILKNIMDIIINGIIARA